MTQIKVLSEKEKVRNKISVWLGSNNHIAVMHTIKELIGNSVDEITKGAGSQIHIHLEDEKTIVFQDDCKGVPVEGVSNGVSNYKLLFEKLFAGTKYDNGITVDERTVGTNGVFLCVLTYASEFVEYEIARPDGYIYTIDYYKGEASGELQKVKNKEKNTYTKIRFRLDDEIFTGNNFTFEEIERIVDEQASILKGSIKLSDDKRVILYQYKDGINEFLEKNIANNKPIIAPNIEFQNTINHTIVTEYNKDDENKKVDKISAHFVMNYVQKDEDVMQIEFLNSSNLIHHGTIQDGFINGLRNTFNRYIKSQNLYKKNEKAITKDDVMMGLAYVIDVRSFFPIYANQTKFASYVEYYKDIIQSIVEKYFEIYAIENKMDMDKIVEKVLINKRSREKAESTRMNIKKKLETSNNTMFNKIAKFKDCKNKTNGELYIVEGDSAAGSITTARDANFQAVMPIRGKILNCLKADYDKIFKSDIIVDLLKVIGCGVEIKSKHKELSTFDISNMRWDKIIFATDEDTDGYNICTLLATMLYVLTPTLLEKGYVYVVQTPLYEIISDNGDTIQFAYNDREKDKIIESLNGKYQINRSKGLGENNPDMMSQTAMNPDTRKLIQLTMKDVEDAKGTFDLYLGDDLTGRREMVRNAVSDYIKEVI